MANELVLRPQSWSFIEDKSLRLLLETDYKELRKLAKANLHKSIAVMCGSIVEAVLGDVLQRPKVKGTALAKFRELYMPNSNKEAPAIVDWRFFQLIGVAKGLSILDDEANDLAHFLRDYRNFIHPTASIRAEAQLDSDTIITILASFRKVIRELSNQSEQPPEERFIQEVIQRRGEAEAAIVQKFLVWAKSRSLILEWRRKSCIFRLPHKGYVFSPLLISNEGWLRIRFGDLKKRKPFRLIGRRYGLLQRFNEVPGINLHRRDAERFPAIALDILKDENRLLQFIGIQDSIVEQIKQI